MLNFSPFFRTPKGKIIVGISATLLLVGAILAGSSYYGKFLGNNILRSVQVEVTPSTDDSYSIIFKSADNLDGVYTQEAKAVYTFEGKIASASLAQTLKAGEYSFATDTKTNNPEFTRADFAALIVKSTNLQIDTSNSPHFSDVNNTDWFFPYVETLVNKGIIATGNDFNPFAAIDQNTLVTWVEKAQASVSAGSESYITRAELAAMLVEKAHLPIDTSNSPHFSDVSSSDWFAPFVETLANNKIVSGFDNGSRHNTFRPNDAITRAETAKLLAETFGYTTGSQTKAYFKDVSSNAWYYNYVQNLAKDGVFDSSTGYFHPEASTASADLFDWIHKVEKK